MDPSPLTANRPSARRLRVRSSGLTWRKVANENETLVLDLDSSEYLALNSTGAFLWDLLAERAVSAEELVVALRSEFEVGPAEAAQDVAEFLDKCLGEKLVEDDIPEERAQG